MTTCQCHSWGPWAQRARGRACFQSFAAHEQPSPGSQPDRVHQFEYNIIYMNAPWRTKLWEPLNQRVSGLPAGFPPASTRGFGSALGADPRTVGRRKSQNPRVENRGSTGWTRPVPTPGNLRKLGVGMHPPFHLSCTSCRQSAQASKNSAALGSSFPSSSPTETSPGPPASPGLPTKIMS